MRWDIVIYVVIIAGTVIFLIWRKMNDRKNFFSAPPSTPVPVPIQTNQPPAPASQIKENGGKWLWVVIIGLTIALMWVLDHRNMPAPNPQPSGPIITSSVTVTREEGWKPINVRLKAGKSWTSNVSPHTAVVSVRTHDGVIHEDGCGHKKDTWPFELPHSEEDVTWFVSVDESGPVTYTVTSGI